VTSLLIIGKGAWGFLLSLFMFGATCLHSGAIKHTNKILKHTKPNYKTFKEHATLLNVIAMPR
jgi:hypothetical protein